MKHNGNKYKFLFAGGGTGGHLFPAVAVADKIKAIIPDADILFIGTKNKIEGEVVPKLGYKFKSIWIKGFSRKFTVDNLLFPVKVLTSVIQSLLINANFKPKVAIGSGGYVAGPAIYASSLMGAKIILIEQNSYPGVTTRMLEKYADEIHVSFEDSIKYFKNKKKIKVTGNPVRENLKSVSKEEALKYFGFNSDKKCLLVLGGSLGARSINEAVAESVKEIEANNIQLIWQTGELYYNDYKHLSSENIWVNPFIEDMQYAYSACDLMISRAGATTIAEILMFGIPSVLIPSPNVAENHQYHNAKSLADKNTAVLVKDDVIKSELMNKIKETILNNELLSGLSKNAKAMGKPEAATVIAENAINYVEA